MKTLLKRVVPLALLALASCAQFSPGNPKLQVDVASCDAAQYAPLPPPQVKDTDDEGDIAGRLAVWGKQNERRMRDRAVCEKRVRDQFARGGVR